MWKTPNEIRGMTPEEIKSDLLADYGCCSECRYGKSTYDNPHGCAERALKMHVADSAHAYIQYLERERDTAVECIDKLKAIFKKYPQAATNGYTYEAYIEIQRFLEAIRIINEVE